jgi:hypothetical protein
MRKSTSMAQLKPLRKNPIIWLGVIAAVAYSSWPLGYILNPVVAHHAFASQLEDYGQPYSWIFIALDVLCGTTLLLGGAWQLVRARSHLIRVSVLAYMVFALLVIVAALVPFNCGDPSGICTNPGNAPFYVIHGLASIVSVVALLLSVVLMVRSSVMRRAWQSANLLLYFIMGAWLALGILSLARWHHADEYMVQYAFISVCSLSLAFSVILIERLAALPQPAVARAAVQRRGR